jgi:hypothetical protein
MCDVEAWALRDVEAVGIAAGLLVYLPLRSTNKVRSVQKGSLRALVEGRDDLGRRPAAGARAISRTCPWSGP